MTGDVSSSKDIRGTELYREAEALHRATFGPGTGRICDIAEINAAPDERQAVCTGMLMHALEGKPYGRICRIDLASGDVQMLTSGPNTDRLPKYSPDGNSIAFLSDRSAAGDFQLHLLDPGSGAIRAVPVVDGWVEYFHWSPDGGRIALAIAGHGADIAGGQGAVTSNQAGRGLPSWIPQVETGDEAFRWRHVWIYDLAADSLQRIDSPGLNVWEAVWCGPDHLAAIVSPGPAETLWYTATLCLIDIRDGSSREIYRPRDQLGLPACSPSGAQVAVVDTVCSDRGVVAGELVMIETATAAVRRIDTAGVDVSHAEWRSDSALLIAGHRGLDTVVGIYAPAEGTFQPSWVSRDVTSGGRYVSVSGIGERGDFAIEAEGFTRGPELAIMRGGSYRTVTSFAPGSPALFDAVGGVDAVSWPSTDGLTIEGWLLKPKGAGPHPLVLSIHGGPVLHARPTWLGRNGAQLLMLLKRGYAIFMPNPRGSSGRGTEFARRVFGDIGGMELADDLSGVDHLIARGIADPNRLAIMGASHGGFMTSWAITQDSRFSAAVSIIPITNWLSEHLTSNIARFCTMALGDSYTDPAGKYFTRSPVLHAHKVRTPTLNICGARDRCTPPTEALQFHTALIENRVESVLVTYPEEGHGVRSFPATVDFAARVVDWIAGRV